jgi:hypothetical protein
MERLFQSGRNIRHFQISAVIYSQIGNKNMANVPASFDVYQSVLSYVCPSVRVEKRGGDFRELKWGMLQRT